MEKRREEKPLTVHGCIMVDGQAVCFDNWPKEARTKLLTLAMAHAAPVMNPGYEAVFDPGCRDLDVRRYITPECIVRFPWMENVKGSRKIK